MALGPAHYEVLYKVLENIHFIYDEHELASVLLTEVSKTLNSEAGSIFKLKKDGSMEPLAAHGVPLDTLRKMDLRAGQGVVGWVAQYAQPVKVDDARKDERFSRSVDSRTGFKTRTIVAAPILAHGKPLGVVEFLNKKGGPFSVQDLELISMIGREIGIAFENATLVRKLDSGRAFFESVLESLTAGLLVTDGEGDILELNPRARAILGVKWDQSQSPRGAAETLSAARAMLEVVSQAVTDEAPRSRQERMMTLRGKKRRIGYSTIPIRAGNGRRLGTAVLFQDLTDLVK